jgi:hypothetical protein
MNLSFVLIFCHKKRWLQPCLWYHTCIKINTVVYCMASALIDHICGLVVRVSGYRSRGPEFDSRRYQIFWVAVGLEWGPLSLMSTIEELSGSNSSGSSLENREYSRGDPLRWPHDLHPQELALTSPTCSGCSVSIVRLRTKTMEFVCLFVLSALIKLLEQCMTELLCYLYVFSASFVLFISGT